MPIDLSDPGLLLRAEVLDDPRGFYDLLRREAPVWQIPEQHTFLVSSPALIREAVARTDDFSSNLVSLLHADGEGALTSFPLLPYGDPAHAIATADPPRHTIHRKILQPHLSTGAVACLEPMVTAAVDEQLHHLLGAHQHDAVDTYANAVPAAVICQLIGLPVEDAGRLVRLVGGTGLMLDGVTDADGIDESAAATLELMVYAQEHLQAATARPAAERTGLLAVLVDAVEAGDLTLEEAHTTLLVLINAGTETTASLIATTIRALAERPELQSDLRRRPAGIPDALESVLREDGPFQFHYRYAPDDTELDGTTIPAGSRVLLMWAAANRPAQDPGDTPHADRVPPHFAFGRGLHFCIGASLARLEARVAIERLLASTSSISLDPDHPPQRRPSIFIRRHATLPLIIET